VWNDPRRLVPRSAGGLAPSGAPARYIDRHPRPQRTFLPEKTRDSQRLVANCNFSISKSKTNSLQEQSLNDMLIDAVRDGTIQAKVEGGVLSGFVGITKK